MCLSTAYARKEGEKILAEYVSAMNFEGDTIQLTDALGGSVSVRGILRSADLSRGVLIIDPVE